MKQSLMVAGILFSILMYNQVDPKVYSGKENSIVSTIEFDYWKACETGEKECKPLTFSRTFKAEKWVLVLPCGGTNTSVYLSQVEGIPNEEDIIQRMDVSYSECPPVFELTNLADGKYYAYILACGLGGQVEINLETNRK